MNFFVIQSNSIIILPPLYKQAIASVRYTSIVQSHCLIIVIITFLPALNPILLMIPRSMYSQYVILSITEYYSYLTSNNLYNLYYSHRKSETENNFQRKCKYEIHSIVWLYIDTQQSFQLHKFINKNKHRQFDFLP